MRHKPTTHKLGFSLLELAFVLTIISIVIVGIAKGSKILQNAGLARAQSLTKSSPVIGMSNLVVWYESAMQNSFKGDEAIDGSSVGTWYNISPYVNQLTTTTNAAQSTPANQPTYVSSGINGLPAIKFTRGSNSLASGSDCMSIVSGFDNDTENVTVFIVWSPASLNAANDMALLEKWGGGVTAYPYVLRFNAGTSYIFSAYDQTVNPGLMDTATRTVGTPTLISASRIKNGIMKMWINGVQKGGDVTDNTVTSTTNTRNLYIGCRSNNFFVDGNIGEIIIFNRTLTDDERKDIEQYLSKKWKIPVS